MALIDDIRENYPQYAWAVNHPELGPLLRQAVDPAQAFSPTRFRAKLMATNWWRQRSASQREYDILRYSDPGEVTQRRNTATSDLNLVLKRLGVQLSGAQRRMAVEYILSRGLSASDPEVMAVLIRQYGGGRKRGGEIAAARAKVQDLARNEYMVGITSRDVDTLGNDLVLGTQSEEAIREEFSRRAASKYPHLAVDLKTGRTMRQLFDGHIATIAEQLELDPDTIDLTSARWNKVLDTFDPSTKTHRSGTISEAMTLARRDERFWKTQNGQAMGAQLSGYLLDAFGMR